jgi:glutathione synthase
MRFVFVMDPLERIAPETDTTYGFIESARRREHDCWHCLPTEVESIEQQITARTAPIILDAKGHLRPGGERRREPLAAADAVFIRKDPPFDQAYFYCTLLLEQLRGKTVLLNDPRGLREANEKLYLLTFARHAPQTIVTADRAAIHQFVAQVGGQAVIKPLDGAGGYGVLAIETGGRNSRAIVDLLTREGRRLAMVQEYLPAVAQGDKRVLVLDGEPLGAILRVPRAGDLRANIHVGSAVEPTELDAAERALIADIAPRLRQDGLYFVGLDLIGGRITEINVTSPTGIRELGRFAGDSPSDRVIDWVEQQVAILGRSPR